MDMKLNYDILFMILGALDRTAPMIYLMKTCRTLHTNGIPALLRLPGLCEFSYHDDARLASFCGFMLVDNRCRYLTFLGIGSDLACSSACFSKDTVDLLIEVLKQAVNLRHLSSDQRQYEIHPILATTISSLTSIRILSLWKGGPRMDEMIVQMRSPIKDVDMHMTLNRSVWNDDPIPILSSLSSTLEQLRASMYGFRDSDTFTIFPRLHTLNVTTKMTVDIRPFIACFPNLHPFVFELVSRQFHPQEWKQTRQSNKDRQRSATWPSLRSLSGTALSLYLLAVCSPVDHLHIRHIPKLKTQFLRCVLAETVFTRLTITSLVDDSEWRIWPSLLSSSKKLTHLSVLLKLTQSSPPILTVLNGLSRFLRCPSVTFLKIRLQPYSRMNTDYINKSVGMDHIQAYAPQVFGIIPTLRYVCFALGVDFRSSWEVYRRNDESPVPELLSKKDGKLVMEAEWDT